jgi:glycosyltransferase involved in cell wall biosynthesis
VAAILVEPESPATLAEAMRVLAGDPRLRDELGRRGRRFAESRLSKQAALAALEQAIVGSAAGADRGPRRPE